MAPDSKDYTWDVIATYARDQRMSDMAPFGADVRRIDAALAGVFDGFAIDPKRVAVVGMSDGASYAIALGGYNADLFSSVLAFSPGMATPMPPGPRPRVFIAHGRNDRVIPFTTTTLKIAPILLQYGFDVDVELFDGVHELKPDMMAKGFAWWLPAS
jgi:phospholipase/carboxylesterase